MAERFYVNFPLTPGLVEIEGPEAHHLARVCRLRPGDAVCLFNGDGREYPAQVTATGRHAVTLEVLLPVVARRELSFPLEVAAPLPKGDRAQFLLEKLTEVGATRFIPLKTQRSVVHPGETKGEKLRRYVIEASKQCGRNVLLQVEPLADWESYLGREGLPSLRILAHLGQVAKNSNRDETGKQGGAGEIGPIPGSGIVFAVGPEGGFTEDEVTAARTSGWRSLSLGPRILRIETAALVLAAWASIRGECL